jgi:mono/diheme cytochrome c family protein
MLQPDMVLLERIRAGRNAMPGYRGVLSDRDILSVIAYTRTLMK